MIKLLLGAPALLVLGVTSVGNVAVASDRNAASEAKAAAGHAARAAKALAKRDAVAAVGWAEQAVQLSPRDAGYRATLGQSYLQAGRFSSARTALEEALELDPANGRVALHVVLAQIATGDWARARATLDSNAAAIPASDLGLAVALAGDPTSAVTLLNQAARQPGATVKTRQNLALALALSGQWGLAKAVAAADMSPADVDRRMIEWAALAQPRAAHDQVAHLLGVTAVADSGRPVALALNPAAPTVAVAAAAPVSTPIASEPIAPVLAFARRSEVVQSIPLARVASAPVVATAAARRVVQPFAPRTVVAAKSVAAPARGNWFVQLGAFDSAGVARDAWNRAAKRFASLRALTPAGSHHATRKGSYYRLAVGGFARPDAVGLCQQVRTRGGACFVRTGAGDQVAVWARKPAVRLAMR